MPSLQKSKILRSRKTFERLFLEGERERYHPILVRYLVNDTSEASQFAFVAPKRNLRKAVQRNRIKRQMREAFRLNQYSELEKGYHVLFIYTARVELSYEQIVKGIVRSQENIIAGRV